MNRFLIVCLSFIWWSLDGISLPSDSAKKVGEVFEGERACFLLKDPSSKRAAVKWGAKLCESPTYPAQTFYLPLTLIAVDLGMLQDEKTLFKWDGTRYENPIWNRDQFVSDWIHNRVDWVTERIMNQIGKEPITKYLSLFHYGNQATLLTELRITPIQQLAFTEKFFGESLNVKSTSWPLSRKLFYLGKYRNGIEVWGQKGESSEFAWFVGHIQRKEGKWNFLTLLSKTSSSKEPVNAERAQALSMDALTQLLLF